MRGKRLELLQHRHNARITPADAGKTGTAALTVACTEDHPRGCGENKPQNRCSRGQRGSPPRMRGKLKVATVLPFGVRITPADAGKTSYTADSSGYAKDHPRGCGENKIKGSTLAGAYRITPADAGKTFLVIPAESLI